MHIWRNWRTAILLGSASKDEYPEQPAGTAEYQNGPHRAGRFSNLVAGTGFDLCPNFSGQMILPRIGKVEDADQFAAQLGDDLASLATGRKNHLTDKRAQRLGRLPAPAAACPPARAYTRAGAFLTFRRG
ncbi:hypothetical protein [Mesorhizobium tamadayense]|uniref:hypothetical protein n=1 Tax=Mesorhizobium tamadayense TaxID=425306 RepID=UPI00142E049B|nr:hypothetical protein [Mesorhizobium tamadayense]